MASINVSATTHGDEDPLEELGVQYWMKQILQGKPIPTPVIMSRAEGKAVVVDGRKRVEAAIRLGAKTISAYVINELSPDNLLKLRQLLNQAHREGN
jgi:hypothetical protein